VIVLALAAAGAGVIHLVHAPGHLAEWAPLGIGFYVAGVLQLAWCGAVLVRPSRRVLLAGAVGSAVFVAFYLLTRTVGLPVGPSRLTAEPFGRADVVCTALEVAVIAAAWLPRLRKTRRWAVVVAIASVLVPSATGVALAAPLHHHRVCDKAPVLTGTLDGRGVDTGVTAYFRCLLEHSHDHY
jgi:hypothetical protein